MRYTYNYIEIGEIGVPDRLNLNKISNQRTFI